MRITESRENKRLDFQDSSAITEYLSAWLAREIPISQAFKMVPSSYSSDGLKFVVPLAPNSNHMGSGFGGSLYVAALLVGWSWLHLQLKSVGIENVHIVIQKSEVEYLLPVLGESEAICSTVPDAAWEKFRKIYHRYGKGRLEISTEVRFNGEVSVRFLGDFVVYNQ